MSDLTRDNILAEVARQEDQHTTASPKNQLAKAIKEITRQDAGEAVDIITYITASWGLGEKPYPIQCFMLKLVYGLPLDDTERTLEITDRFREHVLQRFTEREFLAYLSSPDVKRCNLTPEQHDQRLGQKMNQIIFRIGRRGTKTTLTQWIAAYETYKLLRNYAPQEYYQLRQDQPIRMTLVATSEDQAQALLAPARSAIKRSPILRQYAVPRGDSAEKIILNTQRNLELGIGAQSGIELRAAACSAKGLRGPSNILALLEEYGFFNWELRDSNKSDRQIYTAIAPSTADFTDPSTGNPDGMIMVISTPLSRESHMFELEQNIWDGKEYMGLVLHLPSYWINRLLSSQKLRSDWERDHLGFQQEYEAEYLEHVETAFTADMIQSCTHPPTGYAHAAVGDESCWMGLDLGLKNDGTAIAIVATKTTGESRLIFRQVIRYNLPGYEEYVATYQDGTHKNFLDIEKIAQRVDQLWNYYSVIGGVFDQWNAFGLQSHLRTRARDLLTHVEFNATNNDRVARHAIAVFQQQRLVIYANEEDWEDRESLIWELNHLQRITNTTAAGSRIKIQASSQRDRHDDQYSALSRALWAARVGTEENVPPLSANPNQIHQRIAASLRERADALRKAPVSTRTTPAAIARRARRSW
jgi:hypothetical protein